MWIRAMQLGVEFANGNISDVPATQVQKDVLQIQGNSRVNNTDINANCVVTDAFQVKLMNHNWTQKWRVDFVDGSDESLLAGKPPDPEANPIGNRNWRQQDGGERHSDDHQNN